jgi:ribosomal protein L16
MKGRAMKGNTVTYGEYGLVALQPAWITSNQIEAARIAMTRYIKRGGHVWIKIFPTSRSRKNRRRRAWAPAKAPGILGSRRKAGPRDV